MLEGLAQRIGKEFEAMSYAVLSDPKQPLSYERDIDGIKLTWRADVIEKKANGDILFDREFRADLPTLFGAMPVHSFFKRPDGSVYYK